MSKVFQLLGEVFDNKDDDKLEMSSIRGQGKVIGVYFSAHWCPPCRNFTPKLAKFYNSVKGSSNGGRFEVLFVSSDKSETEFTEYLSQMPWYALPFEKRGEKAKLSKHFKVSGIPTLIFLDGETGKVINKNGRAAVDSDPEGKQFPWKAETLQDMLKKVDYINNKGEKKSFDEDIKGKVLGIYFSAHWCPPCKMFTPTLCKTYKAINEGEEKPFEIIFVSSDQTEEAFKEYFSEMPFLALPFDSEMKDDLSEYFEVDGIPTLIILDGEGNVITSSGRAVVSGDTEGKKFPWHPEPVEILDQLSGSKINEEACLIYIPAGDEDAFEKMKNILTPIGKECQKQTKSEDRPQDLYFFVAPAAGNEIVESLCQFVGIKHDEKSLFIADVRSGQIYKSELAEPVEHLVEKFVKDFLDEKLVAQPIRDDE